MVDEPIEESAGAVLHHRLGWRFIRAGTVGYGPWMHRRETVEQWLAELARRDAGQVEYWVETRPGGGPRPRTGAIEHRARCHQQGPEPVTP
ncbi:MAG: hypothetical protein ACRELD_02200 [Longimicrobiales bacterium]